MISRLIIYGRTSAAARLSVALEGYTATHMASRNMAPRTLVEYRRDIGDLIQFLEGACDLCDPSSVELSHLERYLAELDRRGLSGSSRRRKAAAIRSFFVFLEGHDYIVRNVATRLRPPAREIRERRVLTEAEYRRLQDACRFHPRDQAIIELFLQTGMRLFELSQLTIDDVALPARVGRAKGSVGSVRIRGKGRKERTVTLN